MNSQAASGLGMSPSTHYSYGTVSRATHLRRQLDSDCLPFQITSVTPSGRDEGVSVQKGSALKVYVSAGIASLQIVKPLSNFSSASPLFRGVPSDRKSTRLNSSHIPLFRIPS